MYRYLSLLSVLLLPGVLDAQESTTDFTIPKPPGPHCPVTAEQLKEVESYRANQPVVGTHFFYWYDIESKAHFVNYNGTDALTDHPARNEGYSYKSAAWWKHELLDVMAAGIDFILPVYWGCPDAYDSWSFVGLPPMVQAWEELVREGKQPPRVGLFYDTSTLRHNPRRWHVDLSTDEGKQWFYATIRDFYSFVPPKMWAAIEGRPIVVLYGPSFAAKQDPALFPFVREQFRRDFATDMFLAKNLGWKGEADSLCSWGGALGLKAYGVTSLGPGYDHSAVPNRQPLVVDREGGAFYEGLWKQFLSYSLKRRAKVVLVETWNELHEGTDVCDSVEFGRQYMEMTAKYAKLFRDDVVLAKTGPFIDASQVEWDAGRIDEKLGISMKNSGDGLVEPFEVGGRKCWRSKQSENGGKYVYFDLDDSFMFDEEDATLLVEIEYLDGGFGSFTPEYDSIAPGTSVREGAFRPLGQSVACGHTGKWKTATLKINGGRFANRCNGGDFRLALTGGDLAIGRVTAKRGQSAGSANHTGAQAGVPDSEVQHSEVQHSAKPLIRDCETGYLLNCSFRAMRAYLWKHKMPLSGWETDDRGGVWESSPVGYLPDRFGFHVDWFRLRDTNSDHAVTIKHQIARQTAGAVTWEFRFMMPEVMDGVSWQLRDLKTAAVSMIIRDGRLCCESAGVAPLVLTQIQSDREYGVKAVVNLTGGHASISVDGKLLASDVPFLNPAKTLDYVLIKTGDEAVGQLYLPMVNVHKGYMINESFVAAGEGRLPADWTRESEVGKVNVEQFKCSARPDVFSLRLADGGKVNKAFAAFGKKTVFEYRILLPEKQDGATVALCGCDDQAGVIQTRDGHLCYVSPTGQPVVLVRNYRADLWYAIKMIADPKSALAECFVNGKLTATGLPLGRTGIEFAQVKFAAPSQGTLWLDDVRVYPWREYPADYVPEPRPVNRADDYLVGAISCSLWKEGDAYAGWEYVYPYADKRKPYLGWYDEGNPEVADWEIKWQVEHGIDFEQYCWYRPNDAVNHPIKSGVLEHGIREGLFNARYSQLKKFTIMYTNSGAGRTNQDDWQRHIIPYWIEYFFKDPRYLKVDGKPVLPIYHLGNLLADFGGIEGTARAMAVLRKACRDAGFPGIIILCEERSAKQASMQQMKAVGMDYCFAYTWVTGDIQRQKQMMEAQHKAAAAASLGMVPSVSMGWEPSPWGMAGDGWASVDDYQALAQWTKSTFMAGLPADSIGRNMILLPNWNEFGEGHYIMPSTLAGFGYVDAIKQVFSGGQHNDTEHDDTVPTEAQKRRFTILYPKD